jgi:hypothetical protein
MQARALSTTDGMPSSVLRGRSFGGLAGRKLRFRPQLFWQQVLPEQAASSDLNFHFDLATGDNFARIPSDKEYSASGALARAAARAVADDDASEEETELVARALREAATFAGDAGPLQHLLSSCHCTRRALEGALCEASRRNHLAGVELLLAAGADPRTQPDGKTALHCACEEGNEEVATVLLRADAGLATVTCGGRTALELARDMDFGGIARRLAKLISEAENGATA